MPWSFFLVCSLKQSRFAINLAENLKFCAFETICTFPNSAWDSHMTFPTKQLCKQKPAQRQQPHVAVKGEAAEMPLNRFL